jgi:hypothetical protein
LTFTENFEKFEKFYYQIGDGSDSNSAAQRRVLKIDNVETMFARRSNKSKSFIINIIETRFIRH